jgi:transposase
VSTQDYLFDPIPLHKLDTLSKEDFKVLIQGLQDTVTQLRTLNTKLKDEQAQKNLQTVLLNEQYVILRSNFFGKSSEKRPSNELKSAHEEAQQKLPPKERVQLPSLRYPNAQLVERDIEFKEVPNCGCCGVQLADSGMTEDSERLTVIPKKFIVERLKRHKYRCKSCHGELVTAPNLPRIKEGSAYGDELIIDVAVSKYDYLLPIERYVRMAKDLGVDGLPPQSLIETTHYLADLLEPLYGEIKNEVCAASVLHADETPHRMLEGDKKKNWYLWGFSSDRSSCFELHNTRSGDVASGFLVNAQCTHLMSDVFSGYKKAVTDANYIRTQNGSPLIAQLYCNAHARRKFNDSAENFPTESDYFLESYQRIYQLDSATEYRSSEVQAEMQSILKKMREKAFELIPQSPEKSSINKAIHYFLKNFHELTQFATHASLPIDNNSQERQMRNPVIGRKTWYGTHSKRGAKTAAILYSIIESCKLNGLNSNQYIESQVQNIHFGKPVITPAHFIPAQLIP